MTLDNNLLKKIENFKRFILKSIPLPSTNTPSTDSTNGSTGSSLEYARSDHQHPKSTLYAESVHSHNDILSDLMDNINNTTVVVDSPNPIGQDGDTILLRGRMYGDDVSGKSIDYYIGNTLIGSSVTNSNGVSFLDYECDGLGVRNVTAKNGSIVSEIYEVLDCAFLDAMTTGKKNNKWVNQLNSYTVGEPTDNGTKLTKVSNGNYTPSSVANSTDWNDKLTFTPPLKVEFEITDINGTVQFRIMDSTSYPITLTTGVYEIFIRSTGITFKRNGGNEETLTTNTISDCNVTFATTGSSSADITIKDFKVYPI